MNEQRIGPPPVRTVVPASDTVRGATIPFPAPPADHDPTRRVVVTARYEDSPLTRLQRDSGEAVSIPRSSRHPMIRLARLVRNAAAGTVLCTGGGCRSLPGLPGHPLLSPPSDVLTIGKERAEAGHFCSSFLWPEGGRHAPDGHVRITVLRAPEGSPPGSTASILLSATDDLHGITPRELEVLGLLVEGCSNPEIARALVLAPRTVATHLEHILTKLDSPTRTLAAVRAEREGLYVPTPPTRRGPVAG